MSTASVAALRSDYEAGVIDREQFITALGDIEDYTNGEIVGYDGYIPGTADALVQMSLEEGFITTDELTRVVLRWDERGLK